MKNFILFTILLAAQSLSAQTGLFTTNVSWTNADGAQTRSVTVYVPSDYNASNSYSLVIGFHGQGDSPSNYIQSPKIMGFATNSYFGDVIIACPEEGPQPAWFYGDEDFGILKAVKDHMSQSHSINSGKVFAQGFSFGGKSAFLHGLEEADEIAGIIAYSPAFYGDEDLYNNCIVSNCINAHHDFNYGNADKVKVCTSAGTGENIYTPLASGDQGGATIDDTFLGLAEVSAAHINNNGGDAIFIQSNNSGHSIAPISVGQQCWDHVMPIISSAGLASTQLDFTLYPNPTTDIIYIESTEMIDQIKILNVSGQEIWSTLNADYKNSIDLSPFNKGIYFVHMTSGTKTVIEKIVVQ